MPPPDGAVALKTRPLILWLAAIGVLIPLIGVVLDRYIAGGGSLPVSGIRNLTYPNAEGNVFSWYSSTMLAAIGVGFMLIAAATRGTDRSIWPFISLGAVAFLLSADEAAFLHERLANFASALGLSSAYVYQWLLVALPLAAVVGFVMLRISRSIDSLLRQGLVIAGIVFLAGAVGGEVLGGLIVKVDFGWDSATRDSLHAVAIFVEECLEILGAVLALRAVLDYVNISTGPEGLGFELRPDRRASRARHGLTTTTRRARAPSEAPDLYRHEPRH